MRHPSSLSLIASFLMLMGSGTASAVAVSGQGTWETTLQARDINGDGKTDAYYDTSTNLTWLADANLVKTSGFPGYAPDPAAQPLPSGALHWDIAQPWASSLNIYGVTGWRLPSVVDDTAWISLPQTIYAIKPGTSELENLFTLTLGNTGGQLTNTGPFENVQSGDYWTRTWAGDRFYTVAWAYNTKHLTHDLGPRFPSGLPPEGFFAWAVHTGDVPVVPEPSAAVLALAGGLMIATYARRRIAKQAG